MARPVHLTYTGPDAGRPLCPAPKGDALYIHAGYHAGIPADRICPACLAVWEEATGDADPEPEADDFPAYGPPDCPRCDGPGARMGPLGRLMWARCRNCGHDYAEEV